MARGGRAASPAGCAALENAESAQPSRSSPPPRRPRHPLPPRGVAFGSGGKAGNSDGGDDKEGAAAYHWRTGIDWLSLQAVTMRLACGSLGSFLGAAEPKYCRLVRAIWTAGRRPPPPRTHTHQRTAARTRMIFRVGPMCAARAPLAARRTTRRLCLPHGRLVQAAAAARHHSRAARSESREAAAARARARAEQQHQQGSCSTSSIRRCCSFGSRRHKKEALAPAEQHQQQSSTSSRAAAAPAGRVGRSASRASREALKSPSRAESRGALQNP